MMERIIECVPNFSEGRDRKVIDSIAASIASVEGVKVLNVDPGEAANRTVITFIGAPEAVCEAAFRGVRTAGELIDMRMHHGTHPRIGATDVLPLVPVSGISLEECAVLARALAERIFKELGIACYCYEAAAFKPARRNLAVCRAGEWESLPEKIADPSRRPDFSPEEYNETIARSGAVNVGARKFLIAVNFNLDTKSVPVAMDIACDVREKGRKSVSPDGEVFKDGDGRPIWLPGPLKGCKAIGWYIEEYGIAQVSMNITDMDLTPLHEAYEEVCKAAQWRGVNVTGTEIIGLVPKRALLEAGKYYAAKLDITSDLSDDALSKLAVEQMHLDDLCPFDISRKVI